MHACRSTLEDPTSNPVPKGLFLGIEGGGTRTTALLVSGEGKVLGRLQAGPANLKLLSDKELLSRVRSIAASFPRPDAVAIGMAGAWVESDRKRLRSAAAKAWPRVACYATNDLETALAAAEDGSGSTRVPRVLIISGTGSGCYGKRPGGEPIKIGGWGHILGDKGSGYEIGLRALKASVFYYDQRKAWPVLGQRLLRALQLNEPSDLIGWVQSATKTEIAALAREVFKAWGGQDRIAAGILKSAARSLAQDAAVCARRLTHPGARIDFVMAGSVLLQQRRFQILLKRELRELWPNGRLIPLTRESVWGAVELARRLVTNRRELKESDSGIVQPAVQSTRLSPTEMRHPRSMNLDKLSVSDAVRLMLSEDARVPRILLRQRRSIEQAVRAIIRSFERRGRLFYVGAGTSGRLGVLDASECPATFSSPPDQVQGIIAGGQAALWQAVEGAEDDIDAGMRAMAFRLVGPNDVVVGIAASGTTPFVWGALREAKRRRATTVLMCFNPFLRIPRAIRPSTIIAPDLGPELLTGSTRLKAGTATKLLLNIFTTLAMARTGKVVSNLMVDLNPANTKLRLRAVRILQELTGADADAARQALQKQRWVIKKAIAQLSRR